MSPLCRIQDDRADIYNNLRLLSSAKTTKLSNIRIDSSAKVNSSSEVGRDEATMYKYSITLGAIAWM